jgi:hypothetical protein
VWLLIAAPVDAEPPVWVAVTIDQAREEVTGWAVERDRDDACAAALAAALEHGRPASLHAAPPLHAAAARHDLEVADYTPEQLPLVETFTRLLTTHGPDVAAGRDPAMLHFLEATTVLHQALAAGEVDAVAEVSRTGADRALVMIRPGVEGAMICLDPDDLPAFEEAMAANRPLGVATRGVAFVPIAECDDAMIDELQEHGWAHPEVLPVVHVTDQRGRAIDFDGDVLADLADLMEVLLAAGCEDAVHGRLDEPSLFLDAGDGRSAQIDWRGDLDEWTGRFIDGDLLELEARLDGGEPLVRRLVVRGGITLGDLHGVIQASIDGGAGQPHQFQLDDRRFGPLDADAEPGLVSEDEHRLDELVRPGDRLGYRYAAGGAVVHTVAVTAAREAGDDDPPAACVGGEGGRYDAEAIRARLDELFV